MTTHAPGQRVNAPVGSQASGPRRLVRAALRRDPDDRWAAVFGLIAGYSFAVAVVTGVLLLPFFRPSMTSVVYHGSYAELDGVPMSQAFRSVLAISFDVKGGLLIRQVHHWSADIFVAAICLRLLRTFFRGRFSGQALRDWLIWVTLLPLGMLAAYTGTILPDDGLSGGSLSVITGVLLSVPLIGTRRWVQEVPIVKKTANLIYYTSDSWNRREALVGPGCISREHFEADTRCRRREGSRSARRSHPGRRAFAQGLYGLLRDSDAPWQGVQVPLRQLPAANPRWHAPSRRTTRP